MGSHLRKILEPHKKESGYILRPEKTEVGKWQLRDEPKGAFKTVAKAASVPWCTPHGFRHTYISLRVQEGMGLYKVIQWAGHGDMATTMQWARLSLAHLDEDVDRY